MLNSVAVVSKTFFICTLNASKVIFVNVNLNCELHAVCLKTVCTDVTFLEVRILFDFLISKSEQNFGFPHISIPKPVISQ